MMSALVVWLLASAASPDAQTAPDLPAVLAGLAAYLHRYAEQLPATIATEHYRQTSGSGQSLQEVRLDSDFGIVRVPGDPEWLGFRDVYRVDGRQVRDRDRRLETLFSRPSGQVFEQARRIAEESARFNIGRVTRNINNPALVLELLDGRNQARFRFSKGSEGTLEGIRVWLIDFQEQARPTIIRGPEGKDMPVAGRAWVDPATGCLMRVDLRLEDFSSDATHGSISVTFREDPRLHFWVPATLTEKYQPNKGSGDAGSATYTSYRQFGVETREEFLPSGAK
jgi:hypothetical protein